MSDTTPTAAPAAAKKITITLTDARPVKIIEADWPSIAEGRHEEYDSHIQCQSNRTTKAWVKVRQHDDGRTLVYGCYDYSTAWQGESGATYRDGQLITPSAEDYPTEARGDFWCGQPIIDAIKDVCATLANRSQSGFWSDIAAEAIADLPGQEI